LSITEDHLDRSQRSDQEREREVATPDPGDEGSEEHEDREPVGNREAQVPVQVERRRAEDSEAGRQNLHDDSEYEQRREQNERPAP
jgi:hypothetical protein